LVQAHLQRKFNSVYYFRNKFEIDCIANNLKIEVKVGKPHRNYPKEVLILDEKNLPLFLAVL
jgi:predicted AAA+ superfamily ATPase